MKVAEIQRFYNLQRTEFWLGMTALLGVILIEVLPGLMIAVIISLIYVIYKSSRPHGALLGRVPRVQGVYTDLERHPENTPVPGLIIFRLDSPLYFANASLVKELERDGILVMLSYVNRP